MTFASPPIRGSLVVPRRMISADHSLSRPIPSTSTRLGARASIRYRHGFERTRDGAISAAVLIWVVLICGRSSAEAALPSVQAARLIKSRPAMVPPEPLEMIRSGPVTVALSPAASSKRAFLAAILMSIFGPDVVSSPRSTVPLPLTLPPFTAVPLNRLRRSSEPAKLPRNVILFTSVPDSALCIRKLSLDTDPRTRGLLSDPVTSAATDTGPVRSKVSIAESRHKASAGPAKRNCAKRSPASSRLSRSPDAGISVMRACIRPRRSPPSSITARVSSCCPVRRETSRTSIGREVSTRPERLRLSIFSRALPAGICPA